jgi:hydrophobic/amphiphilic exporter-1 (mainly G- bacteria), HAE1 family
VKIADFSVRRPVTIAMIIIAAVLFGVISLTKLKVDLYPELNLPVAVVATSYQGASPSQVEKLISKPIEEAVGTVSNISKVQSQSANGSSIVIVQFNWGTNMDQATLDMRDKIDRVRGSLPKDADSPRVMKLDPNSQPIITMAMSGPVDVVELNKIAQNLIQPRIERIDGVASLGISGGRTREIQLTVNPDALTAYGITVDQINQALTARNLSGSAGSLTEGGRDINIKVTGEFDSPDDIGHTPITLPKTANGGGGVIQLADLLTVTDGYQKITQESRVNGQPSIGLSVTKASGANTVTVAQNVLKELDALRPQLPKGVKIVTILDSSIYIKDSIHTLEQHGLEGSILAILILFVFLNSFRSMLVAAIVIPISLISTFALMYFTGQTINLISLMGLMLGIGSLVDFSVVVLESIYRKRQQGLPIDLSSIAGAKEVGTAVMASALAQIAVFLPIVFVNGIAGQLFGPLALTVVFSHIAALIAAITLVPMMSSKLLTEIPKDPQEYVHSTSRSPLVAFQKGFYRLSQSYGRLVNWSLNHRKTILITTLVVFLASVGVFASPLIGKEFLPSFDQGDITVNVKLPPGSRLQDTEGTIKQVEQLALSVPEKDLVYTSIGSGGSPVVATSSSNQGSVELKLVPKEKRKRSTDQVMEDLRNRAKNIVGADITVAAKSSGMPTGSPISIQLEGDDLNTLKDISDTMVNIIKDVKGTRNVTSSFDNVNDEIQVKVDSNTASQYGITTNQILSAVNTAFGGQVATKYRTGDDQIDVRVQFPESYRSEVNNLSSLMLSTPTGAQVSVGQVAQITKSSVPQQINRNNQTRAVSISADIQGRDLNSVNTEINAKLAALKLPQGYRIDKSGGQGQNMADSFSSLGLAIVLSILLVYMVMAGQFESLFYPFVIMFSIPPTLIGVVVGLLVTGQKLGVMAIMGYILLIGIVTNNAIVLIDYINTLRKEGMERNQAVLTAGPVRLRPILMTTLATVLAILPLAFGGGQGSEGQTPLAVVVAFGLTFSTLVTLVLVPVVYTLFDDMIIKRRARRAQRRARKIEQRLSKTGGKNFDA